jgi:DNA-binding NtrC family response regulator
MQIPMDSGLLFVSPYPQDARSLAQMLDDASLSVVHVRNLKDAASKLETGNFQVVVTEANLEDGTWLDLLQLTRSLGTELVVTDPWADGRFWAEVINLGAYDLLAQPFHETEVRRLIASASSRQPDLKAYAAIS